MGLNGALYIGRSALLSSQAAMQVAGNNMANAATPGYHRQIASLSPSRSNGIGHNQFVGTGVHLNSIHRVIDTALQARMRAAISDENASQVDYSFLSAIETIQNELSDQDLSSRLSEFFNAFSELGNAPNDHAVRSVVLQQGASLSGHITDLREEYTVVREEVDRSLAATVERVDGLLGEIAGLNAQIAEAEGGGANGEASSLHDQRDVLIDELSQYMDVTTVNRDNGAVDVLINSVPVVLAGESRGIELRTENGESGSEVSIRVGEDGTHLEIENGTIGGLLRQRAENIDPAIEALDTFTSQLIFQVNKVHSQGQGTEGRSLIASAQQLADTSANLNADASGLPWQVSNGTFQLHMIHAETGERVTYQVHVDPDTMSLEDLVEEINVNLGIPNLNASINSEGRFQLEASDGYEIAFTEDESGVLGALGMNAFFTGSNASDIMVDQALLESPGLLATSTDFSSGGNGAALAMVALQDAALEGLDGASLREYWQTSVSDHAVKTGAAETALRSDQLVRSSLEARNAAVSGVSLDEEAIDLMSLQRQFQAAARYITVIDETMEVLLSIA
ncbi:MAG: flagellar hook-associated protein FlgK [Phycisphaerales bacterium]|nr:flagellar hook-associated protein FlgK [Phycisphaerales bacterium]